MNLKILIIEDDAIVVKHLSRAFERKRCAVASAHNAADGLAAVVSEEPDVVLLDLNLPDRHGLEIINEIKRSAPACEVVIITGASDAKPAMEAMRSGAFDYIVKPLNMETVMLSVERIANNRKIKKEHSFLQQQYKSQFSTDNVGIYGPVLAGVFEDASRFAPRELPVLILGESGTGKELVARHIHSRSVPPGDNPGPFIPVNCSALPAGLFESELFGYAPGAFTGAERKGKDGKIRAAHGGSIFLDEVGEIVPEMQVKLLRFLEDRKFFPVGSNKETKVDVKVICATNRNLADEVVTGNFRKDLFFRINVGLINIPPLRERRQEIIPLTEKFLYDFASAYNRQCLMISSAARSILENLPWHGNVRELKNFCERVVLVENGPELTPGHLMRLGIGLEDEDLFAAPAATGSNHTAEQEMPIAKKLAPHHLPDDGLPLDEHIDSLVIAAYEKNGGNQSKTARYLGVTREVLRHRLKKLGVISINAGNT